MEEPGRADEHDVRRWYWPHGRELAAIAAFWALFAALSVMNWMFPPTGQEPPMTARVIILAAGAYAELHVGDRRYVVRESMQTLEERLDPRVFMRI